MLKSYPLKVQITVETNQTAKVVVLFVGCLCVHVRVIFFSPVNRNILKYVCDLMPMNYHERLQRPCGKSGRRCQHWKRSAVREMGLAAGGEMRKQ